MTLAPSICGVVLSAGFSSRMGRDKALLPWPPVAEGTPVVNTFLGATIDLLQAYCDLVIVVAGRMRRTSTPVTYEHAGFLSVNPTRARTVQFASRGFEGRAGPGPRRRLHRTGRPSAGAAGNGAPPARSLPRRRSRCLVGGARSAARCEAVHGHPISSAAR